jgi:hypothetical protein
MAKQSRVFFLFSPIQLYFIKNISYENQNLVLKIFCLAKHKNAIIQFINVSETLGLKIIIYNIYTKSGFVSAITALFCNFNARRMIIGNYNSKIYKYASTIRSLFALDVDILDEGSNIYLFNKRMAKVSNQSQVYSFSRFACLTNPEFIHVSPSLVEAMPCAIAAIPELINCKFLILGSADVAEGLVTTTIYLEKLRKITSLGICAYYPHRRENIDLVSGLLNIRIINAEYPFEQWFLSNFSNNRSLLDRLTLVSFGSTCVTICSEIYPSSKWLILKYSSNEILESYSEEYFLIINGLLNDVKLNKGIIDVVE